MKGEDAQFKAELLAEFDHIKKTKKEAAGAAGQSAGSGDATETKVKTLTNYQVFFKEHRDKGMATKEVRQMWKDSSDEIKAQYKVKAEKINAGEPICLLYTSPSPRDQA